MILAFALLPISALAAAPGGQVIYVGNVNVTSGGYWTTDSAGNVTESTAGETPTDNYIHYDAEDNVLTLHNATIKKELNSSASIFGSTYISGSAIGVFNLSGNAELTIDLVGTNTIANVSGGIYVLANSNGGATLTITGNGSLTTEGNGLGSHSGISVLSFAGNANLTINNVDVTATNSYAQAIRLQPSESASATLTVNGGSLTASGSKGIDYQFGTGATGNGTPSLTVSGNAIVRVNGGITNKSTTALQIGAGNSGSNGGIVWNGTDGTVYGKVELQEDLEIGEGETLTIGQDASLNTGSHEVIVNGGTLTGGDKITGTVKYAPTITTESLPEGEVNKNYSQPLAATGDATITWNSSDLPEWLTLDTSTGVISGTPTTAGTYNFTVTATNGNGSDSKAFTLIVAISNFEISSAAELRNFAETVNTGNVTANAVLTADITLTGGNWTPIGKENACMYNGTFDGQGHTISGLDCSVSSGGDVAGLFGYIGDGGVVKNVGIADSDVAVSTTDQNAYAGGLCGHNAGTIQNCWNSGSGSGSVSASSSGCSTTNAYAGGLCGWNQGGTIRNCWNSGSVSASSSSSTAYAGGVCGENQGTIQNCYWLAGTADSGIGNPYGNTNAESKTTDEFASGEVAWLLNQGQTGTPWGQGSNNMPVLKDNLPAGVTSYEPIRITIVTTDGIEKFYYSAKGSTFTAYPTGYAYFFKDGDTETWINKGTQTYDTDTTIYAENMTLEKKPAKDPTCTEDGNSEYWYFDDYDKYFSDANGVNEITAESTVIPATGHSYGETTYAWSDDNTTCTATRTCKNDETHTDSATATVTSEQTKAPTCTEKGETTYTATFSVKWAETQIKTEDIPANGHHYVNGTCTVCGAEDPNYEPPYEPSYFSLDFDVHPCEGVTLNSNLTAVEEGGTLYLYVEKDEELYNYDNMRIYVKRGANAEWEELTEDPNRPGVYPIREIRSDIFIKVEGVTPKDPTAIAGVETLRIYATGNLLHVETPTRQRVTIVSMAGALIADGEQEGVRIYRDLNAGIYIVRVGDYATKVRVE